MESLLKDLEKDMKKTEEALVSQFNTIRTGKASPALVEHVMVDYYGTKTPLREIAGISTPEPRLLTIQPWDMGAVAAIEKAIISADIGINPVSDGKMLRLPIPELSQERRKDLSRQVKAMAEDAKISIRNIRRDGNDKAREAEKKTLLTEDELKRLLDGIQELTDRFVNNFDKLYEDKEKELMTV